MTPSRVAYLFFLNATLAAGLSFAVLCVGEYLIPGFASPFVDLVHLGLDLVAACMACVFFRPHDLEGPSTFTKLWQGLTLFLAAVAGGILLWAKLDTAATGDIILLAVYGILCVLSLLVTLRDV